MRRKVLFSIAIGYNTTAIRGHKQTSPEGWRTAPRPINLNPNRYLPLPITAKRVPNDARGAPSAGRATGAVFARHFT